MIVNYFPEIILCSQPSVNMDALKSRGDPAPEYCFKRYGEQFKINRVGRQPIWKCFGSQFSSLPLTVHSVHVDTFGMDGTNTN